MTRNSFKTKNTMIPEFIAETLGTFTLVCIGLSVNASVVLSGTDSATVITCFGWGLAVTAAVYVCGGVSGGHCNPAVTLAFAFVRKFNWRKVPHYIVAQYFGAFLGTLVTYFVYIDSIKHKFGAELKVGGANGTANIFVTHPNEKLSIDTLLVDQIVSS
ncbi:Aquaporin-9-like protein, partial [Leptotrombidium deliense]